MIHKDIGASDLGEGSKMVLETVLPARGEERVRIMEEVDKVIWHYLNKIAHEERLRTRFRQAQKGAEMDADVEDEATQVLINGVSREFDFSELATVNAEELATEESNRNEDSDDYDDDSDSDDDSSEYEMDSDEIEEDIHTFETRTYI